MEIIPGDVTNDMIVSATDVIATTNVILGQPSGVFNYMAADINGDGQITIADVVGIVKIIMGNNGSSSQP